MTTPTGFPEWSDLAQVAIERYHADPSRVARALKILQQKSIYPAKYDENGMPIARPTFDIAAIPGQKGWYVTRKGKCTCRDCQLGNVCKHRIALWIYIETEKLVDEYIHNQP